MGNGDGHDYPVDDAEPHAFTFSDADVFNVSNLQSNAVYVTTGNCEPICIFIPDSDWLFNFNGIRHADSKPDNVTNANPKSLGFSDALPISDVDLYRHHHVEWYTNAESESDVQPFSDCLDEPVSDG